MDNDPILDEETRQERICNFNSTANIQHILVNQSQQVFESMQPAFQQYKEYLNKQLTKSAELAMALDMTSVFSSIFQNLSNALDTLADQIKTPSISDERKQELIRAYTQWSAFGWTPSPNTEMSCFSIQPNSVDDADKRMMDYCNQNEMGYVFEMLREYLSNDNDLESAIFCYQNRQYKACVLLLFSLIDRIMVREQEDKWPQINTKGIEHIEKKHPVSEEEFYTFLDSKNLFNCLLTFYEFANGFRNEGIVINRNYVSHGMTKRIIGEKDCIQVFLALYNLLTFLAENPVQGNDGCN